MTRVNCAIGFVISLFIIASGGRPLTAATSGPHDYFNALIARAEHWKSYTLRDSKQVNGYANSGSLPPAVTYSPDTDTDPHAQDAAKIVIPAFSPIVSALATGTTSSATSMTLTKADSNYYAGRALMIDHEAVKITAFDQTTETATVERGAYGTIAGAHSAGAGVRLNVNGLQNQMRLPIGTTDGHSYVFTWDAYWTDSYLDSGLDNHKTFQFSSGGDTIWLEPQTRYSGAFSTGFNPATDVASLTLRSYNAIGGVLDYLLNPIGTVLAGPIVTSIDPIKPKTGEFIVKPDRWTRFWVRIDQRANDYDYMDYWAADEAQNPVQLYNHIPLAVRTGGTPANSIAKFWVEFNTSQDRYTRSDTRDLVTYIRNFVVLRDVADPTSLLQMPASSGSYGPMAPRNLHIVR